MLATKRRFELKTEAKWLSCFVSFADSTVYEVDFSPLSDGLEILSKVCRLLGIVEVDYFGLAYQSGHHGNEMWLNLRNRITHELSGRQPYQLDFRVKFFIPAHMIQQDVTRHQFYLSACEAFLTGRLHVMDRQLMVQAAALIVHAEDVCSTKLPGQPSSHSDWLPVGTDWRRDSEISSLIDCELSKLAGMSRTGAENRLLQLVDSLPMYGASFHIARDSATTTVNIATTSDGLVIFSEAWTQINSIGYAAIQRVTNDGCNLVLEVTDDAGATARQTLKLASRSLAGALYRSMTEMYYFYHCASVGRTVMRQSSRDFKGTLASLFNENTEMGKSYVFDIQRTMREAYDKARRVLFDSTATVARDNGTVAMSPVHKSNCADVSDAMATAPSNAGHRGNCASTCSCCMELRESIEQCRESMRCQICADADVDTAFVPCGHVACCTQCSLRLDFCPLCKVKVTQRLKIYLPAERRHICSGVTGPPELADTN